LTWFVSILLTHCRKFVSFWIEANFTAFIAAIRSQHSQQTFQRGEGTSGTGTPHWSSGRDEASQPMLQLELFPLS
jgi:hypothetical protein